MSPPKFFFQDFFGGILSLLNFYMIFRINLSIPAKKASKDLEWDCVEFVENLRGITIISVRVL